MNLDSLGFNLEEQIFYGVITLYLYECTGTYNNFDIKNIVHDELNEKNIEKVLFNLKPLSYIKEEYDDIYLPCIPDTDIKLLNSNIDNSISNENNPFTYPLIKFNLSMLRESEEFQKLKKYIGIMSGKRSAILKGKSGKLYRLKGCGNYKSGFTLLEDDNRDIFKKIEIRGCQFENNVFRELYYSEKINEILKKNNIPGSNIPVGYFKYDKNIKFIDNSLNEDNEIKNEVPEIDKYCSIYETLGDRRLGSHLLKGMEMLIGAIVEAAIEKFDMGEESYNNIYSLFPEARRKQSINSTFIMTYVNLPKGMTIKEWCSKPIYEKECYDNLICYNSFIKLLNSNSELIKIKQASNSIEEWEKFFRNKLNFKKEHFEIIMKELKTMKNQLDEKSFLEFILDIFIRIGYETAKIKRIFQDEEFNWGSYNGHSPFDDFCSAHNNNFIVLPAKYSCLLSPIDFDLSFKKDNFINNDKNSKTLGKHDELIFDKFMNREINKLLYNIINPNEYYDESDLDIKTKFKNITYYLLNDSLIEYFMKTFDKIECDYIGKYDNTTKITEIIVKLCLIATYDRIS